MEPTPTWQWSEQHGRHYYISEDGQGQRRWHWSSTTKRFSFTNWTYSTQYGDVVCFGNDQFGRPVEVIYFSHGQPLSSIPRTVPGSAGAGMQQQPASPPQYNYVTQQPGHLTALTGAPHQPAHQWASSSSYGNSQLPQGQGYSGGGGNIGRDELNPQQPIPQASKLVESDRLNPKIITNNVGTEDFTDRLDQRYRVIREKDRATFYVPGRVFAVPWTENANSHSASKTDLGSGPYTVVRYGQLAHTEIRRYVVVRSGPRSSHCIPIHTYGGQATLKPGCSPEDHSVIYTSPTAPAPFPEERITKQPIRVIPRGGQSLRPESRLNFGKTYCVEHYCPVINIGRIIGEGADDEGEDLVFLMNYWRATMLS